MNPLHFLFRILPIVALTMVAASAVSAQVAVPTFSAGFTPSTIGPGATSTLTFTVTNGNATPVDNLAFSVPLPGDLKIVGSGASSTCIGSTLTAVDGTGLISFANGGVAGSGSCTVTVPVTATTVAAETLTTGDLTSDAGNSGPATATLTVSATRPGFSKSLSKSTVSFGETFTITYTITQPSGAGLLIGMFFSETLPSGFTIANPAQATSSCNGGFTATAGSSTLSHISGFITAGTACTAVVDVVANEVGTFILESSELAAGSPQVSSGTSAAQVIVTAPAAGGLSMTKRFIGDPVGPGETALLEFTIRNHDRDNAVTGIGFTDDMDATLSGMVATGLPVSTCGGTLSGTSVLAFTGGSLAAGSSCTFDATIQLPGGVTGGSYPSISGTIASDQGSGGSASDTLEVVDFQEPQFSKSFTNDPTQPGSTVVLSYSLTNPNPASAVADIAFSDPLSAIFGDPFTSSTTTNTCGVAIFQDGGGTGDLIVSGGSLAANTSCQIDLTMTVPVDLAPGDYASTSTSLGYSISGTSYVGDTAFDTLTIQGGANLNLSKKFSASQAVSGGSVDLTFTISSAAESVSTATALAFTDDLSVFLPGSTLNALLSNECGGSIGGVGSGTLTYSGGTIDPGNSCDISVRLDLGAGIFGTRINTTSQLTATAGGTATTAGVASDSLFINASEPVSLSIDFNPASAIPGATTVLTFTLENPASNPTNATGILFFSNLGSTLSGLMSTSGTLSNICGTGSQITGTTLPIFTGGDLAPGATCSFSLNVEVPASAPNGGYNVVTSQPSATVNAATVTGEVASDTLTVQGEILQTSKSFTNDPVVVGDSVTLQFSIENTSADDAVTAIAFTDDLDAMLSGAVATGLPVSACGGTLSGTTILDLSGGSLAAGGSCTFDVTVQVPGAATAGSYTNTTSNFSGILTGLAVSGAAATDSLQLVSVAPPSFGLSIAGDPVAADADLTFSFTITNNDSGSSLTDLEFSNDLDAALSGLLVTAGTGSDICGSGSTLSGTSFLSFTGGTLGPSESCSFDITVQTPSSPADGSYDVTTSALLANGLTLANAASDSFTVDATDPSLSGIDLIASSDSGASNSDDVTSEDTPTVEFTAESGATVEINWDDGAGFVAASSGTGAPQQETLGTGYGSDGDKTIQVRATDAVGNTSTQSLVVTIDTEAPAAPATPDLQATSDSGVSDSDDITADTTPSLSGTAENNANVSLSSSPDGVLGTTAADGSGRWSFTVGSALSEGDHQITTTATDLAGNTSSASTALAVRIDISPPSITASAIRLAGATGTGGAFKIGDMVTATWDNSASGDGNTDVDSVTVDFSAFGGGSALLAANSGDSWTVSYTIVAGTIDDTNRNVSVDATDLAGNSAVTAGSSNETVDAVAPILTAANISVSGGSGSGGIFIIGDTITVVWDNSGSGDNNSDGIAEVTVDFSPFGGGSTVAATDSGGLWTATFDVGSGTGTTGDNIEVTATDNAGNTTMATDTSDPDLDTTAPDVIITSDVASLSSGQTATITFSFSETPVGFEDGDVTIIGGTLSSVTEDGSDTTIYTAVFTPTVDSTVSAVVTVAAGSYRDAAGNLGSEGVGPSLTVDTTTPGVTISSDVDTVGTGETAILTFTFTEEPTGFKRRDITVTSGRVKTLRVDDSDARKYTATYIPSKDSAGTASISIAAGGYTDSAGNAGSAGAAIEISYDTAAPSVTLSAEATILSGVFRVTATFDEEMTGFRRRDITVGNGRASNLASSDNTIFTFDVTPQGDGEVTIDIAAGVARDAAGNDNSAAEQLSVTSDSTAPSVEISGPTDVVGELFQVTVTFSESVTGFRRRDLSITHGSISNFAGSGASYSFEVTPEFGETVVIGIAANAAKDTAGNGNLAAQDYSVRGSSLEHEFEEHRDEIRDIITNEAYAQLNAQISANTRMVRQARNRFILGKTQLGDPGGGYAARNNIDFDIDGGLGFVDGAFNTRGVFSQQRGNFEGSYRRILFGDFDLSRDQNGTVSAYISGKVAWEHMINDRTMLGYNIGLDLGRSDIEGAFSGSQDSIGVSIGGYFVSQLGNRLYADGFISFGAGRNNLELDNGILALSSDYDSYTTTLGAALTGVYEMSGYELWPELSFTYGYTDIGVIGLTGTAFGLSNSNLTLDAGYVALSTLSFAPEFIVPMDGRPALESNRMLSFKPNLTCEMIKSGTSTSNCGGGMAVGIYAVSKDGQALLDAKVRIDRIGDITRTGLELRFDYAF
ncbi:MAG: hypothetical protein COB16_11480 [Rhodobacteraceae bacterium]|nr:MAG: hypothetical protein COB16_11480 [Paracoccaceae bacterium]